MEASPSPVPSFSSTTAPGKIFHSRTELAAHYESAWHRYNLQRRAHQLPPLTSIDFQARTAAAAALRAEKAAHHKHTDHVKPKNSKKHEKKTKKKESLLKQHTAEAAKAEEKAKNVETVEEEENNEEDEDDPAFLEIDPCQSLFCSHVSESVDSNITFLQDTYGFFLPDQEHVMDGEGLVGYCHEKIQIAHTCLYCQKHYRTAQSTIQHMLDANHTKLRYELDVDLHEFDVFYDFDQVNQEFLAQVGVDNDEEDVNMEVEADNGDENDEDWEDVDEGDEEDDDEWYEGYKDQMTTSMGFGVTSLGELIFPDGRIVGHRNLRRYYKQQTSRRVAQPSTAVTLARQAAHDQLINGRVINTFAEQQQRGKGVLVSAKDGGASFTQLSLYRYRAAVRKQQYGDRRAQVLYNKAHQNTNKMDKKHNRLMNGVSVAHAAR